MGRHTKPTQPGIRLAGWVWMGIVVLLMTITLILARLAINKSTEAGSKACPAGDYTLAVWAAPQAERTAHSLIDAFNSEEHIVTGFCVMAEIRRISDNAATQMLSEDPQTVPPVWIPNDPQSAIAVLRRVSAAINTSVVTMQEGKYAVLPLTAPGKHNPVEASGAAQLADLAAKKSGSSSQIPLAYLD